MIWLFVGPTRVYLLDFFCPLIQFTFESLSLIYLLVVSWFIYSRRWCIDKLEVFHANQISICLDWSTSDLRVRLAPWNRLKPFSKIFYWPFQGGTSFMDLFCFFCLVFAMSLCASVYMCLVVTCWERADLLSLVCGVCEFVTFPLVSWVRCVTWLYRFLIFAPFLTFTSYIFQVREHGLF